MANTNQAIGEAQKQLAARLLEAGHPADRIVLRADPGPDNTVVVTASVAGSPDRGVSTLTAVVLPAASDEPSGQAHVYGEGFAKRFSDLVRDKGWLDKPPEAALLVALLNASRFHGMLRADPEHTPSVSLVPEGVVLRFVRLLPDGSREWVRVRAGPIGAETVLFDAAEA